MTASAPEYAEIPEEIQRDRWGRPLIVPPGGGRPVAYTRCTTFVGALEDTYNLGQWMQRMAVAGITHRPDLHLRAASLGLPPVEDGTAQAAAKAKQWKEAMNRLVDEAREAAAASAAATVGTSLHAITEAIDAGQTINLHTIPERYHKHLAEYQRVTAGFTAVHIERFLVNDELKIGGTADRIMRIEGHEGLFIGDIKTGSIEYGAGKIAMQLSVYARSQMYTNGTRTPVDGLRTDRGVIIHLDAKTGECTLHWADLATAWEAVGVAGWVRTWRSRKGLLAPAHELTSPPTLPLVAEPAPEPAPAPKPGPQLSPNAKQVAGVMAAIGNAKSQDELVSLWAVANERGLWTDAMTEASKARISQLQATAA